jgi:hypothetical protein
MIRTISSSSVGPTGPKKNIYNLLESRVFKTGLNCSKVLESLLFVKRFGSAPHQAVSIEKLHQSG